MEGPLQDDLATSVRAPRTGRVKRSTQILLAAITLFALALRWTGVAFELPHVAQVDEQVLYRQLLVERGVDPPARKHDIPLAYPTVIARCLHFALAQAPPDVATAATTSEHLALAAKDVVDMRFVLAFFAACGVPLVFLFARRFVADEIALLAALWLGISILHGWYSAQARPHAALCTFAILAVVASIELRRRADARSYLLAGLATGIVAGSLQSGLFLIPAFFMAHFLRNRNGPKHAWLWFAVSTAIVFACVAFFYRHGASTPQPGDVSGGFFAQFLHKIHGIEPGDFGGLGFGEMLTALWNYDPWLGLLALGGVLALVTRTLRGRDVLVGPRGRDIAVVLSHAIPHVVAFGLFARTFQRFLMPVVPYLCLLAAWFLFVMARRAAAWSSKPVPRSALALGVLALPTAIQAYPACKIACLRHAPDTATSAARWLEEHADREHDRIALAPTIELPLLRRAERIPAYLGSDAITFALWTEYQLALPEEARRGLDYDILQIPLTTARQRDALNRKPAQFMLDLEARYVVLEVVHDSRRPILRILRDEARRHGHLVARFASRSEPREEDVPLQYQFDGPFAPDMYFAWRVALYTALGSDIEIYEFDAH